MNRLIAIMSITTLLNGHSLACMERNEEIQKALDNQKELHYTLMRTESKIIAGWTALAGGAFVSKKILSSLSANPQKNHYVKYARYARNIGCIALLPYVSFAGGFISETIQYQYGDKDPYKLMSKATKALLTPWGLMVVNPAILHYVIKQTFENKKSE